MNSGALVEKCNSAKGDQELKREYGVDLKECGKFLRKSFVKNQNLFDEAPSYTLLTECRSKCCFFSIVTHPQPFQTFPEWSCYSLLTICFCAGLAGFSFVHIAPSCCGRGNSSRRRSVDSGTPATEFHSLSGLDSTKSRYCVSTITITMSKYCV